MPSKISKTGVGKKKTLKKVVSKKLEKKSNENKTKAKTGAAKKLSKKAAASKVKSTKSDSSSVSKQTDKAIKATAQQKASDQVLSEPAHPRRSQTQQAKTLTVKRRSGAKSAVTELGAENSSWKKHLSKDKSEIVKEKSEYKQGALFMDEYEAFHEEDRIKNEDNGHEHNSSSVVEESSDISVNPQLAKRQNGDWMRQEDAEGLENAQELSAHAESSSDKEAASSGELAQLQVKISNSLHRKLLNKAELEGVSVDEFVAELLAEGLVLRAWEIMERKSAMRSNHPNNSNNNHNYGQQGGGRLPNRYGFRNSNQNNYGRGRLPHGGNNGGGSLNGNGNGGNGNGRRMNYNHIMEDSANFLEYVRNQEKKQR